MSSGSRVILISKSLIALAVAPLRRPLFEKRPDALFDVFGFEQFFQVNLFRPFQHGGKVFQRRLAQAFKRDSEHGAALARKPRKQGPDPPPHLPAGTTRVIRPIESASAAEKRRPVRIISAARRSFRLHLRGGGGGIRFCAL